MKHVSWLVAILTAWPEISGAQQAEDPLCRPLLAFIESVQPDQRHEFAFHTVWGGNFKDSSEPVSLAKRCLHNGYEPANGVCKYLMVNGFIEFSGANAERVVACLSPETRFARRHELRGISLSIVHGTEERGSLVSLEFNEDPQLGGKVLRVSARGY